MEILVNKCFGGFNVSKAVFDELGIEWTGYGYLCNKDFKIVSNNNDAYRADQSFVAAVKKVGLKSSSTFLSEVRITKIPDNIEWEIDNYDGIETIHEVHRRW